MTELTYVRPHPKWGVLEYRRFFPKATPLIGGREFRRTLKSKTVTPEAIKRWTQAHEEFEAQLGKAQDGRLYQSPKELAERYRARFMKKEWRPRLTFEEMEGLRDWLATHVPGCSEDTYLEIYDLARDEGRLSTKLGTAKPFQPQFVPPQPALTITGLFDQYEKDRQLSSKSSRQYQHVLREFIHVNGDLPVKDIIAGHIRKLRNALRDSTKKLSVNTINGKKLSALNAVFNWAVEEDLLDVNPAQGVKARGADGKKRKKSQRASFSPDNLRAIFSGDWYEKYGPDSGYYWLPILGLFTGGRNQELAQLVRDDITEENGIWSIRIAELAEGQILKTNSSWRTIPVHDELIRLGFIDYVLQHEGRIFPDFHADRDGYLTGHFSKEFNTYLRKLGMKDKRLVFYSFRHHFSDMARRHIIDEELRDILMGHATGKEGSGRDYGHGHDPDIRANAVRGIKMPVTLDDLGK